MQTISTIAEWEKLLDRSRLEPVVLYKHSNACRACERAERELSEGIAIKEITQPVFKLVVQELRELSDRVAADTRVEHETPQVIILSYGRACFVADYMSIDIPTLSMQTDLIRKTREELMA